MSKERPILMNSTMVRATLAGTKAQTRRAMKHQPAYPVIIATDPHTSRHQIAGREPVTEAELLRYCPYGQLGDRLWVRETFYAYGRWVTRYSEKKRRDEWHFIDMTAECDRRYQYDADSPDVPLATGRGGALPGWYRRPAIFMPRAACRIELKITSVRVERLQDISDANIEAEGIDMEALLAAQDSYDIIAKDGNATGRPTLRSAWRELWESTGGDWDANPWLWVVGFRRVMP